MIRGEFDSARVVAAERPRSFFDRLRGRRTRSLSTRSSPDGHVSLEFPADAIALPLIGDFMTFVRKKLESKSAASQVVLEYMDLARPEIYLRGERGPGETKENWYVQVSFRGCAGMAETSAHVAAHWACLWYAAERARIRASILSPIGFAASEDAGSCAEDAFVPTREHGYAEFTDGMFEVDASFLESMDDPEALLKQLQERYGPEFADGKCHCDLCRAK